MFPAAAKDNAITDIKETAREVKDDLHNVANRAGRKVRSLLNSASDEITHASDKVTTEIRTNPVRSSMVALGVGLLFGALLRR